MAKSISRYLADISSTSGVLDGTLSTAAQTNITSLGTLSSLTVSGSAAMTLTTAAQPNITSVGTLSSLSTSGNISTASGALAVGQATFSGSSVLADFHGSGSGVGAQLAFANDHNTDKFYVGLEGNTTGDGFLYQQKDADINFYTNNTFRAKIDNSGNVGIGTATPSFDLEINRASAAASVLINSGNNDAMLRLYTANNVGKWRVIATTSDDNLSIQNLNSGASAFNTRMTFTDAGKVGIGTAFTGGNANAIMTAPLNIKLTSGSSAAVATFNLEHSNQSANIEQRLQFNTGDDGTADSYSNAGYIAFGKENTYVTDDTRDSYLSFATATNAVQAERMRISSTGDVTFSGASSNARIASHSYGTTLDTTTSDGSDTYAVGLDSGGGGGSTARGAGFWVYGNEASSYGGSIVGQMGAAGHFKLFGSSGGDSLFNLNPGGALGLEKSSSRFIVGTAYNVSGLYATGSTSAIGLYGANAYSSCGAHIETATDADSGWSPFYINKFDWASGDDARWISFGVNGYTTDYGTIEYDGTNFAIVNASDYRLKENIVDYSGGLAKVEELKVRTYNKKEGVSKHITQQGFIAHEAATANIPGFISGEKDAMKTNEAGETVPDYQTINKEALIPYLVSAIQELSAKVKELESK